MNFLRLGFFDPIAEPPSLGTFIHRECCQRLEISGVVTDVDCRLRRADLTVGRFVRV